MLITITLPTQRKIYKSFQDLFGLWEEKNKTNFNRLNDSWNRFKVVDFSVDTKGGTGEKLK